MSRPVRALIDLGALQHNYNEVITHARHSKVLAVIKADAYGHGMVKVARALPQANALGVESLEAALELRQAGITQDIVLLAGFFSADELPLIVKHQIECVVHCDEQVQILQSAQLEHAVNIWLKLDTGMGRLGLPLARLPGVLQQLTAMDSVADNIRLMTHFSDADRVDNNKTWLQYQRLLEGIGKLDSEISMANSAAILAWPDTHADWVRPGIMLYGISPFSGEEKPETDLRPVMTLESNLIAVNQHQEGDCIGYGSQWVCPEKMRVGVVAAGYGDGYPREVRPGTPVLVNGQQARLIGRVSMDLLTVDLREVDSASVGDRVILWGNGLSIETIAQCAGTIPYTLCTGISSRVPREYIA